MNTAAWPITQGQGIHVVGLNPSMDRTEEVPGFQLHQVNRSQQTSPRAGGKSFIVARALRRLGVDVAAHGFLGGAVGSYLREECHRLGIRDLHTGIAGETRINTIVVDPGSGSATVINEPGPEVSGKEFEQLRATLVDSLTPGSLVAFTGSLPQGVEAQRYTELIAECSRNGTHTLVDAAETTLVEVAGRGPWAIKCNLEEFSALDSAVDPVWSEARLPELVAAMRRTLRSGTRLVLVTLGPGGLVAVTEDEVVRVHTAPIVVQNPTGSGDTLLAGLLAAAHRGTSLHEALELGSAAAAANAATITPDIGPDPDLNPYRAGIRLSVIEQRRPTDV